jgi:hypothetical protein
VALPALLAVGAVGAVSWVGRDLVPFVFMFVCACVRVCVMCARWRLNGTVAVRCLLFWVVSVCGVARGRGHIGLLYEWI